MARPMSYEMLAAIKRQAPLILLAKIEHPSGDAYMWSGVGTLTWNGFDWTGMGTLGTIAPIEHSSQIAIQEIQFTLTGADPTEVQKLSDDVCNRSGAAWLACLDERGNVVADPFQIVDSQLDFQSEKIDDDGTATIQITARTGFYTLERAANDVWSAEDQRKTYPDDSGLDLISKLLNQELVWAPS